MTAACTMLAAKIERDQALRPSPGYRGAPPLIDGRPPLIGGPPRLIGDQPRLIGARSPRNRATAMQERRLAPAGHFPRRGRLARPGSSWLDWRPVSRENPRRPKLGFLKIAGGSAVMRPFREKIESPPV